jgi:hypothetical protein
MKVRRRRRRRRGGRRSSRLAAPVVAVAVVPGRPSPICSHFETHFQFGMCTSHSMMTQPPRENA